MRGANTPVSPVFIYDSLLSILTRPLWIQSTEKESDKEEDQSEANAHESQRLDDKIVLELIYEAIAYFAVHRLILINRQQVQVDELCLGQHQLYITIFVCDVIAASCAVEKVAAVSLVENLHINQPAIIFNLLFKCLIIQRSWVECHCEALIAVFLIAILAIIEAYLGVFEI